MMLLDMIICTHMNLRLRPDTVSLAVVASIGIRDTSTHAIVGYNAIKLSLLLREASAPEEFPPEDIEKLRTSQSPCP
jgi:hypothetical protein